MLPGCATPGWQRGATVQSASRSQPSGPSAQASGSLPNAIALVPLYSYPSNSSVWAPLVSGHQQAPSIPVDAIVNVDNGPGKKLDANYQAGVAQLHAGGIAVLGYVYTRYGRRALGTIEHDIERWQQVYAVDGIFLDEMASKKGHESLYASATSYAKSLGLAPVIGNPGTNPSQSYEPTVDAIVIWENDAYPTLQYLGGGWHSKYDRSHFGFIAYDQSSIDVSFDQQAEAYVLYEFVTNGSGSNPYAALPPYLDQFLSTLQASS